MSIAGLHHFNLRVPADELDALVCFYRDVLGFVAGDRPAFASRGYWLYANQLPLLHITEMNSGETVAPGAPTTLPSIVERFSTMDHVALSCTDLEQQLLRLDRYAVPFVRTDVPGMNEVQLFCRDPSGNGVELIFVA